MNANQLPDAKLLRKKLKNGLIVDKWDLVTIIEKQETMLCQQADRIAELEHMNKNWQLSETMAYNRIAELEKDLHMLQRHYDQLDHDTTPQIKALSDEEIYEIGKQYLTQYEDGLYDFARAILKKASEK